MPTQVAIYLHLQLAIALYQCWQAVMDLARNRESFKFFYGKNHDVRVWGWVNFLKWVRQQYRRVRGRGPNHPPLTSSPAEMPTRVPPAPRSCALASRCAWCAVTSLLYTRSATSGYAGQCKLRCCPRAGLCREACSVLRKLLTSPLECTDSLGSLAQRAGVAIASRVTM